MVAIPEQVAEAWENRKGPAIFGTVDEQGMPNVIYVGCVAMFDEGTLVVADNHFSKTRRNILQGSKGALLFMGDGKAYQVKGTIEYHTEGEVFDHMKSWNPEKHPGNAAAALKVEEVYSGAEKLA